MTNRTIVMFAKDNIRKCIRKIAYAYPVTIMSNTTICIYDII
jgi:hypothetical protein